jgi:hypothetical protein
MDDLVALYSEQTLLIAAFREVEEVADDPLTLVPLVLLRQLLQIDHQEVYLLDHILIIKKIMLNS